MSGNMSWQWSKFSYKTIENVLTLSLPRVLSLKLRGKNLEFQFGKIVKNKQHHLKILLNNFHSNGHTLGFQTQKVQPHLLVQGGLTPGLTVWLWKCKG